MNFSTPVAITANTTYVAAYLAPNGHYSDHLRSLHHRGVSNPPLRRSRTPSAPTACTAYSATSTLPTSSSNATNYWVDVDFEPAPVPGQVTNVSATAGNVSANVKWSARRTAARSAKYTITPFIGSEAQPTTTVTGTPPATEATITGLTSGTTYTFIVQASNPNGASPVSQPPTP